MIDPSLSRRPIWPGDNIGGYKIERLVAYQGREGCTSALCTRRGCHPREDGTWDPGECFGWHCSLCDEPCSSFGHHDCKRSADVA